MENSNSPDVQPSSVLPQQQNEATSNPFQSRADFRTLPLLSSDLPYTTVAVPHSQIRFDGRGKDVLFFIIHVDPGNGKVGWKIEKSYGDIVHFDHRVRKVISKGLWNRMASLLDRKLLKDIAPVRIDQRKAVLGCYFQSLVQLPVKDNFEVIAFLTSDIVREKDSSKRSTGPKDGYLTKRGKNFGGWKSRYFVLDGATLGYYSRRGGSYIGSINLIDAKFGRQTRRLDEAQTSIDDPTQYRHAFLIIEKTRGDASVTDIRHVLCAENDEERDEWVGEMIHHSWSIHDGRPSLRPPSTPSLISGDNVTGLFEVDSLMLSQYSLASSRTESTNYGHYCRRMALSQETLRTSFSMDDEIDVDGDLPI